jgi:hypothetical protein
MRIPQIKEANMMNKQERELVQLAEKMITFFVTEQAQKEAAAKDRETKKKAAEKARAAAEAEREKLRKHYREEAAKRDADADVDGLKRRVEAANAQVDLQAKEMSRLQGYCATLQYQREWLLALMQDVGDFEQSEIGTKEFVDRFREGIRKVSNLSSMPELGTAEFGDRLRKSAGKASES